MEDEGMETWRGESEVRRILDLSLGDLGAICLLIGNFRFPELMQEISI